MTNLLTSFQGMLMIPFAVAVFIIARVVSKFDKGGK